MTGESTRKSIRRDATHIKHTRVGVWDLYEDRLQSTVTPRLKGTNIIEAINAFPAIWQMLCDIAAMRDCWLLLATYIVSDNLLSLLPAVSLWYSAQLLGIVQTAVDHRTVDTSLLFRVAFGRFITSVATRILRHIGRRVSVPLKMRIKQFYSIHMFHAMARLDVPTFSDPAVQRQLEQALPADSRSSIAWDTLAMALHVVSTTIRVASQLSVLLTVLRHHQDGLLLAMLSFSHTLFQWFSVRNPYISSGVWAATTTNQDFIRTEGLKRSIIDAAHRKEIVAGAMWTHMLQQYRRSLRNLGDKAGDFFEAFNAYSVRSRLNFSTFLEDPLRELPQIVFSLRAAQHPADIPLSLASLNLITQTTEGFSHSLFALLDESESVIEKLSAVRRLYEIGKIENVIKDGDKSLWDDTGKDVKETTQECGLEIEFRDVSFKYPDTDSYALRNVSFKIRAGQLCVILGVNGSGKSTILKLISRLYDPISGSIHVNGQDVRDIRLADLRAATSVLFQDYTVFPVSIGENIALGATSVTEPSNEPDLPPPTSKIIEAAELGGAASFVSRLPKGYKTTLDPPVKDYFSGLPEGSKSMFGEKVNFDRVRQALSQASGKTGKYESDDASESDDDAGKSGNEENWDSDKSNHRGRGVSGGEMQRIALSRTFMRSLVSDQPSVVGLLLFDEPSASLDPTAEHDLFERLRKLRGNKTMVFSSHRFGNLTRHADIILYMNDSVIVEEGTHDELIRRGGEYARIWRLQAQAFL